MALIWAKKSTGMPIEVRSAHAKTAASKPQSVSHCVLDIDIHKNQPAIQTHTKSSNAEGLS